MKLSDENKGLLYCILSGLMYGGLGYFGIMVLNSNMSIANMLLWRYVISSCFIFMILLPKIKYMRFESSIFIQQLAIGFFIYAPFSFLYFESSLLIGTGLAMVIFFTYPAFVMALRWAFYGKKIPRIYHASIITIFCGLLLLMEIKDMKADIWGSILALASAFLYAIYIVGTNSKINTSPPLTASFTISIGGVLCSLLIAIYDGSCYVPTSLEVWQNMVGIGIIATAIPILFLLEGLRYVEAEKASILSVLEPVLVFFIGVMALNEEVSFNQGIGASVILVGALLVQFDKRKHGTPPAQ